MLDDVVGIATAMVATIKRKMSYQLKEIYALRFAFKIKLMGKIKTNFNWAPTDLFIHFCLLVALC